MRYEVVERLWFEWCYGSLLCKGLKPFAWAWTHRITYEEEEDEEKRGKKPSVRLSLIVCLLPSHLAGEWGTAYECNTRQKGHQMHSHTFAFHFSSALHCAATIWLQRQKNVVADCSTSLALFLFLLASFGLFFCCWCQPLWATRRHRDGFKVFKLTLYSKISLKHDKNEYDLLINAKHFLRLCYTFSICAASISGFHPMQAFNSNVLKCLCSVRNVPSYLRAHEK